MCSPDVIRSISLVDHDPALSAVLDGPDPLSADRLDAGSLGRLRSVRDLTHTLTPDFPIFPAYRPLRVRRLAAVERDGFAANELCFAEHTGTHLDAPAHFFTHGATADRIPASRLVAPLAVVSIAERAGRDPDALVSADDLLAWERKFGRIPSGAVVALHSGWEERLSEPGAYLNVDAAGVLHSPGFSREAAEFLVHEREIVGAATDTLSLDAGASTSYEAHRALLSAGKYGLENVANLGSVPASGAVLFVGAPKHLGATGGPARLLALF